MHVRRPVDDSLGSLTLPSQPPFQVRGGSAVDFKFFKLIIPNLPTDLRLTQDATLTMHLTASAVAERYGIPFMASEASAPSLTERGFKWLFRPTPIGTDFGAAYASFLTERRAAGFKIEKIALGNENTEYGTSVATVITSVFKEQGQNAPIDIAYVANATDVQSQVLQLKDKKPDVVIMISYTSDAILYSKTMQALDYKPARMIADDSGYSDPSFIKSVGKITQGVFNRSSWNTGSPGSATAIIADLYKKKSGDEMDATAAREMQALFVLADAIDHAGSTEPAKIQAALKATDLKPAQLMIGYNGIKFDDTGQNILASTFLIQLKGKEYVSVWPPDRATSKIELPMKGWH